MSLPSLDELRQIFQQIPDSSEIQMLEDEIFGESANSWNNFEESDDNIPSEDVCANQPM